MFEKIEEKHKELINAGINLMKLVNNYENDIGHVLDVLYFTKELLNKIDKDIDKEVCVIAAYWHEVGRVRVDDGYEKLSAEMLKQTMKNFNYDDSFIEKCYKAIEYHGMDMKPTTIEGLVIKDACQLAWLGDNRWDNFLEGNCKLDRIVILLDQLRNEVLYFDESKELYDIAIIDIFRKLYKACLKNNK